MGSCVLFQRMAVKGNSVTAWALDLASQPGLSLSWQNIVKEKKITLIASPWGKEFRRVEKNGVNWITCHFYIFFFGC